jgi:electron transfer flavoprotein-quinone oxidoreductase
MDTPDFDVIIVGAGIAGSSCALLCARAGLSVLLLERATQPGAKNMSGGRLYSYALENLIPDFASQAPVERQVTQEKISLLSGKSATTFDYLHPPFSPATTSWTILRARFDPWLMEQARHAGAECMTRSQVEDLFVEDGVVRGVVVEGETLLAGTVVLAEGANTLLAERYGLLPKPAEHHVAIGVKEVLALPQDVLENRFSLEENEGAAWLFSGDINGALPAGGFLYTNKETISLGIVCPLSALRAGNTPLPQMMENFRQHPRLKSLLKNSELLEYGAHLVPEGGMSSIPRNLAGPGWLVIGDSARFCVNTGLTIRGMDLAILSAQAAAQTLSTHSEGSLRDAYHQQLQASALWSVLKRYQHLPEMLLHTPALYSRYPQMLAELQREHYETGFSSPEHLIKRVLKHARRQGFISVMQDLLRGVKSL